MTPKGDLAFVADCAVPYTEQALRRVDHRFAVRTGGGADQFKAREGSATIQGCVTGGTCELVEVIAIGCTNPDWTMGEDGVCRSSRDGTDDGSGTGGSDWGDGGGGTAIPGPLRILLRQTPTVAPMSMEPCARVSIVLSASGRSPKQTIASRATRSTRSGRALEASSTG